MFILKNKIYSKGKNQQIKVEGDKINLKNLSGKLGEHNNTKMITKLGFLVKDKFLEIIYKENNGLHNKRKDRNNLFFSLVKLRPFLRKVQNQFNLSIFNQVILNRSLDYYAR
jgi:hypothetical protein